MASKSVSDTSLLGKIAGYTEILAKDPRSTVFVPLAEAYRQMELLDDALEVASNGVRALPVFTPGYTALGRILAQRGAFSDAVAAFEKALSIDPAEINALKGLARVRMHQGDQAQARRLLQRAAELKPEDETVRKMLQALASAAVPPAPPSRPPVSAAAPASAGHESPKSADEPISTVTIAEIYIRQGFPKRALKVYRDLLQADPHNEEIRRRLIALKQQIGAQTGAAASPAVAETPAAAETSGSIVPGASGDRQVEALNHWLDSLRKRRADVR